LKPVFGGFETRLKFVILVVNFEFQKTKTSSVGFLSLEALASEIKILASDCELKNRKISIRNLPSFLITLISHKKTK